MAPREEATDRDYDNENDKQQREHAKYSQPATAFSWTASCGSVPRLKVDDYSTHASSLRFVRRVYSIFLLRGAPKPDRPA